MSWEFLCGDRVLKALTHDVRHPFDADATGIAFQLDDLTVLVFEDPDDGYRSCANEPLVAKADFYTFGSPNYISMNVPVKVTLWEKDEFNNECRGIIVSDVRTGKPILTVGTDNTDDYYPSFVANWQPENMIENANV